MPQPDHDYRSCRDQDCPRFPCRVYREGYEHGYADGFADGQGAGYAAGYSEGYGDGQAAAQGQDGTG